MLVYKAISAVTKDIGLSGLAKNQENKAQGFKYRGIDDLYNLINPILAKNELCILPRVIEKEFLVVPTKFGTTNRCLIIVEYDIVAADGSKHTVQTIGEANDSGDKAANKAMSVAYKYMALMVFAIPIVGNDDADAHTEEAQALPIKKTAKHVNIEPIIAELNAINDLEELRSTYEKYRRDLQTTATPHQQITVREAATIRADVLKAKGE